MPPSVPETGRSSSSGQTLAITAEVLYLVNLLLVPGLAFVMLLVIYFRNIRQAPALAACHLRQTVSASLWAGVILVIVNLVIILEGGYDWEWTWVIVILYFTICHTTLVLLGTLGLVYAMNGKPFRYPLIGRPCHEL